MESKQKNIILSIIRTALIVLWVYAAVSKLSDYPLFTDQLKRQPLPMWSVHLLAWVLPLVELLTAVLIYFQKTLYTGLVISSVLMISFTVYVSLALSGKFGDIPCSCAGLISSLKWKGHFIFNVIFSLLSITGTYLRGHKGNCFIKKILKKLKDIFLRRETGKTLTPEKSKDYY